MKILLNGKDKTLDDALTIHQLLHELNLHPRQVAVEINREIIKRERFQEVYFNEGDEVEIVRFVGGGEQA